MIPDWIKPNRKMSWESWGFYFKYNTWFMRVREHSVQWFRCRKNKHIVKFGSYGDCIFCHKHIGYGKNGGW